MLGIDTQACACVWVSTSQVSALSRLIGKRSDAPDLYQEVVARLSRVTSAATIARLLSVHDCGAESIDDAVRVCDALLAHQRAAGDAAAQPEYDCSLDEVPLLVDTAMARIPDTVTAPSDRHIELRHAITELAMRRLDVVMRSSYDTHGRLSRDAGAHLQRLVHWMPSADGRGAATVGDTSRGSSWPRGRAVLAALGAAMADQVDPADASDGEVLPPTPPMAPQLTPLRSPHTRAAAATLLATLARATQHFDSERMDLEGGEASETGGDGDGDGPSSGGGVSVGHVLRATTDAWVPLLLRWATRSPFPSTLDTLREYSRSAVRASALGSGTGGDSGGRIGPRAAAVEEMEAQVAACRESLHALRHACVVDELRGVVDGMDAATALMRAAVGMSKLDSTLATKPGSQTRFSLKRFAARWWQGKDHDDTGAAQEPHTLAGGSSGSSSSDGEGSDLQHGRVSRLVATVLESTVDLAAVLSRGSTSSPRYAFDMTVPELEVDLSFDLDHTRPVRDPEAVARSSVSWLTLGLTWCSHRSPAVRASAVALLFNMATHGKMVRCTGLAGCLCYSCLLKWPPVACCRKM